MTFTKWVVATALALLPAVAWSQQNITLVCQYGSVAATIDVDYANSHVCSHWTAPSCVVWPARISDRYISWSESCSNCPPIVIDRVTSMIKWIDGTQGTCTPASKPKF